MAVPPKTNEAFLREVDEELRRDQLTSFWTRYGKITIVAIVVALAAFGAYLFWQHQRREAAGVEGEKLQAAFDLLAANNPAAAKAPLAEIAGSGNAGYAALAKFTQGDIALQKNDLKAAAALFAGIAADTAVPQPMRDLALVRQTSAEYDTLKPQVVIDRLRGLAVAGNPWFGSAGEMVAIAYLRTGRRDLAGRMFGAMARQEQVPASLRQRAVQMAGVLGVDAVAQNEDTKAQ
ncbi:hypothetical protein ASE75_12610 [Sphingomonas sp. Leaf17]|uniref:tetratricopeptide repeat protein n=1 Tax=Sphingomonas sp. Leaf17 TaxID=1735683 RepID=UPI0006F4948E|nr:tetratricopeptide repeat protein [Sphingomonas sp. Leaf17]KQM63304.1 hypothetical protein ASE75_12610 [Sphingomonas sp. Leaf17]